jgi:hypothetical protein
MKTEESLRRYFDRMGHVCLYADLGPGSERRSEST